MFSTISSPHLPGTYHTAGQNTTNPQQFMSLTRVSSGWIPPRCQGNDNDFFGAKAHQILKIFSLVPPTWSTWSCPRFFSVRGRQERSEDSWIHAGEKTITPTQNHDFGNPWKLEFWASFFVWKPKPSQAKTGFTCLCFHHDFL